MLEKYMSFPETCQYTGTIYADMLTVVRYDGIVLYVITACNR